MSDPLSFTGTGEATREALAIDVDQGIKGEQVVEVMARISSIRGAPRTILATAGAISAKGDGYIVSPRFLRGPAMEERVVSIVEYFHHRLMEMIREGLEPAKPMPWLIGRPALLIR